MRRPALVLLAQLVVAAPLAAQFEGTISMRMSNTNGQGEDMMMKISIKGDKQASVLTMPASAGPMSGMEARMIVEPKTGVATTLMPLPPGMQQMPGAANAKGIKMVFDFSKAGGDMSKQKVDIKKLGSHQRIAGIDCDDYEITPANGKVSRACIAEALGYFVFPQTSGAMGRRGGAGSQSPAWARAFGGRPGFPLKVWSLDGSTAMEVTSVDRVAVPASLFEIPEGYVDMATLMRGRGGQ
jgi:hypothetical protein